MGAFLTLPVLAPLIAAETGLPASLAGVNTALVYGGALVSGPMAQAWLRRHGGIRVCQGALLVIAAAMALATLGHPLALLAAAVLAGLGHGPLTPAGSHVLAARTPARIRGLVFGLKQCGVPLGTVLVATLAPALGAAFGWRVGALAITAIGVVSALALQPLRRALDADRDPAAPRAGLAVGLAEARASIGLLRGEPRLRAVALCACGLGVSQFTFLSVFVVWQVQALGTPLVEAGARLAAGQVTGALGRVLWAMAADRVGAPPVLVTLGLGTAAAMLAAALAGPDWPGLAVVALAAALGATAVGWQGMALAEVARLAPPGRVGAATAAFGVAFALAMLVAPNLVSLLTGLTGGYAAGFLLCAALALAPLPGLRRGTDIARSAGRPNLGA
jgi:MFS family permease